MRAKGLAEFTVDPDGDLVVDLDLLEAFWQEQKTPKEFWDIVGVYVGEREATWQEANPVLPQASQAYGGAGWRQRPRRAQFTAVRVGNELAGVNEVIEQMRRTCTMARNLLNG